MRINHIESAVARARMPYGGFDARTGLGTSAAALDVTLAGPRQARVVAPTAKGAPLAWSPPV